jgi:hypothetical protein
MALPGDYAIVDATEGRDSKGQVLVIVDDEATAREFAMELRQRGCCVDITSFRPGRGVVTLPAQTSGPLKQVPIDTATA